MRGPQILDNWKIRRARSNSAASEVRLPEFENGLLPACLWDLMMQMIQRGCTASPCAPSPLYGVNNSTGLTGLLRRLTQLLCVKHLTSVQCLVSAN